MRARPGRFTRKQLERKAAVDAAHTFKYDTPGSLKYVRDLRRPRSRDTTTQLVPL